MRSSLCSWKWIGFLVVFVYLIGCLQVLYFWETTTIADHHYIPQHPVHLSPVPSITKDDHDYGETPSRSNSITRISSRSKPVLHVHPLKNTNLTLQPLNQSTLLALFNAKDDPILRIIPPREKPIRIRILLFQHKMRELVFREKGPYRYISDEIWNICMDGIRRSTYFELVNVTFIPDFTVQPNFALPEDDDIVWIIDMRRTITNQKYTIPRQLAHLVKTTLQYQQNTQHSSWQRQKVRPTIRVVLLDYRDRTDQKTFCTSGIREVIPLLGGENEGGVVRSVLRQVVRGRRWNANANFVQPGEVWDSRRDNACFGCRTLHIPYTVRSDYADFIRAEYPSYLLKGSKSQSPADTFRPIDVAHFWPARNRPFAILRDKVSELVLSLGTPVNGSAASLMSEERDEMDHSGWNVIADFVSAAAQTGRTEFSSDYLQALLRTKIVVVAQRDAWEDHYRLFEAIVGGALVMTDPMLAMPDGLVHQESIVVYNSLENLRS